MITAPHLAGENEIQVVRDKTIGNSNPLTQPEARNAFPIEPRTGSLKASRRVVFCEGSEKVPAPAPSVFLNPLFSCQGDRVLRKVGRTTALRDRQSLTNLKRLLQLCFQRVPTPQAGFNYSSKKAPGEIEGAMGVVSLPRSGRLDLSHASSDTATFPRRVPKSKNHERYRIHFSPRRPS